jgi:outer membrane biosynthesis protein TonB
MASEEQTINYKALTWTVGAHVVILLLLILWKFSTPAAAAPVMEMGMEVNLGTSADGSGNDQPMDTEDPAEVAATNTSRSSAAEAASERDVEQTDDAEAPDVAPVKTTPTTRPAPQTKPAIVRNPTSSTTQQTAQPAPKPQPQKPKFVYQGSTGRGGNGAQENRPGGGEGNTTGEGDRGVPHGTPGASNYTGTPGSGTGGISFSLSGRNIVAFPPKEAEFREGGKVVVRITVNRDGVVVNKNVVSATNAELRGIALRKLGQVKFNRNEQAPAEQFGNITFVFKARN